MYGVTDLLLRLQDRDTGRRPAARRFFRDAHSAVRLPESRSRLRLNRLTGSHTALWASRTNRLAAGRRPVSRSCSRGNHTRGQLRYTVHSPPCPNVLRSHAHSPTILLFSAETPCKPVASLPARHVAKWHNVRRRIRTACSSRAMVV